MIGFSDNEENLTLRPLNCDDGEIYDSDRSMNSVDNC